MKRQPASAEGAVPRRIRVQAARWVTELHGPHPAGDLEQRIRRWVAEDSRHAAAFALASAAWERSGQLLAALPRDPLPARDTRRRAPAYLGPVLAAAAVCCAAVMSVTLFLSSRTLQTGPGERRTAQLPDGSSVSLNANSRLLLEYTDRVRKVTLASGDAVFDVAKHQPRPFVVVIGDRKVIAMGTSFMVRRDDPRGASYSVILLEGRIAVEPITAPDLPPSDFTPGLRLLSRGERIRYGAAGQGTVDAPPIDRVTAWQRGQLIFENTSLQEAAAEFNRYRPKTLMLEGRAVGELRMGGVFRIDDPASFARAMADTYHLRVAHRGRTVVLSDAKDE